MIRLVRQMKNDLSILNMISVIEPNIFNHERHIALIRTPWV